MCPKKTMTCSIEDILELQKELLMARVELTPFSPGPHAPLWLQERTSECINAMITDVEQAEAALDSGSVFMQQMISNRLGARALMIHFPWED